MPVENLEEEGLCKNPDLGIAHLAFLLTFEKDDLVKEKLLSKIKSNNMAPYYEKVCSDLGWVLDNNLLKEMKENNQKELAKLDEKIKEEVEYESDEKDALISKAEYLCKIGDKDECLSVFRKAYDKTLALGQRLDIIFNIIRIGMFYMDHDLITRNIDKAKQLIDDGGDWDRRNRLKVYQGLYSIAVRDFKQAANLFLETVSTFTSYELMDYKTFVKYTVYICMMSLDRAQLRDKVVKGSEILEVLFEEQGAKQFLFSFYECQYAQFFRCLAAVEEDLKTDRFFHLHYRYYVREMRILAYTQLLESYRSLTLEYMAQAFGVTIDFIDKELSRFIAIGRLNCKIDKVGGIVETNRPDSKNWQYQETIKKGDLLLNRVQKLSRVINM